MMSDDERTFMYAAGGSWATALNNGESVRSDADTKARGVIGRIHETFHRTEALLVLSVLAEAAAEERDRLVSELLDDEINWSGQGSETACIAWPRHDLGALAFLAGMSQRKVSALHKTALQRTLDTYNERSDT